MTGGQAALSPPTGLDWWKVKASGPGEQSVGWDIADGRYDVVVMNADGSPGVAARITFGIELAGAFRTCLLVFAIGLVLLIVGVVLMLFRRRRQTAPPVPVTTNAAPLMPYTPPAYEKQGQVRRSAGPATGVVLLLVATGCVAVPVKHQPVAQPAAVTLADGKAVVARYNEVNNKANQARDAELSEAIEGDPRLAQTRAGYQIDGKLDAAGKKKTKSFTYAKPHIGAPEFSSYPMRFVVSSGVSDDPQSRQLGVWQRQNAQVRNRQDPPPLPRRPTSGRRRFLRPHQPALK